jgi:transposase
MNSTHTRPGNPYLTGALGVAAMSAARSKDTYLAAKYRRIASRRGPLKAIIAIEHTMLIAIWNIITNGVRYREPGADFYTRRNPDKAKNRALDQLRKMGYAVTPTPLEAAG